MIDPPNNVLVSFVISTFNRREILLYALEWAQQCGLPANRFEILLVDNDSPDGTAEAVAAKFPSVVLFPLNKNIGSCAKNIAMPYVRGKYVVFLDDDAYPMPGSIDRMLHHFESQPKLGAAVFTVSLTDGSRECSAYPDVFIGCGTGFRREALEQVGLLPNDFFMQAEEYDLSLRLLDAGWDVRTFDDLHVTHLKTPSARRSWRTMRLDVRNNLVVARKYFPEDWYRQFAHDWMGRYWRIANARQQRSAFIVGLLQGLLRPVPRRAVSDHTFERFARIAEIESEMRRAINEHDLRSVLFLDFGKNMLPYRLAAEKYNLKVVAIADNRLAGSWPYHDIPIVNDAVARRLDYDAAIVSNLSPVHAQMRAKKWRELDDRPVIEFFPQKIIEAIPAIAA